VCARMKRGSAIRRVVRMEPFLIVTLVRFEVALWQWCVAMTIRGNLVDAMLLGLLGAIVQVTAISPVVEDMRISSSRGLLAVAST
jgi:uncharacterized membrane protein YiaA